MKNTALLLDPRACWNLLWKIYTFKFSKIKTLRAKHISQLRNYILENSIFGKCHFQNKFLLRRQVNPYFKRWNPSFKSNHYWKSFFVARRCFFPSLGFIIDILQMTPKKRELHCSLYIYLEGYKEAFSFLKQTMVSVQTHTPVYK